MAIAIPIEPMLVAASGSVGDLVFSHNQHGPYRRDRTIPTDPATALQVTIRDHLSTLATAWNTTLSQDQRDAWREYATAVTLPGRLGRRNRISGLPEYVRTNVPRLQANEPTLPRLDNAPTSLDHGPYSPLPRIVLNVVDQTFHPFFDDADAWRTESGAAMLFWASPAAPLTVTFHKGPYRFAGALLGSDPRNISPGTLPLQFPATTTDRVFLRGRVTRTDGRLTESFRLPAVIVPQVPPLPVSAVFTPLIFPRAFVDVTFDALIRREPHLNANWTVRFGDSTWSVTAAQTINDVVRLNILNTGVMIGPDFVTYAATPADVNGLLTGLAVAPFTILLT
jgi:hypothetical protein